MSARLNPTHLSAAIGAVLFLAGAPAAAQDLSEVAVTGHAPTQITISLTGKSVAAVRGEVRIAAKTVCRNAVTNRELAFHDQLWCSQKSASKALRRYDAILSNIRQTAASPTTIVLSLR